MNLILKPFCHREKIDFFCNDIFNSLDSSEIPEKPGAYIFSSQKQRFIYPNGTSQIIYIGKAKNLRQRIKTHLTAINEIKSLKKADRNTAWYYSRHQYLSPFGGQLFCFQIKGLQNEQNLENKLLEAFYDRYLALPVGNGAFSFKKT